MVVCSVIGCGMRKSRNQASLTMHRFPTNASKKKMWLDAIGIENIKTNIKCMHICSLHFHEECFNKTLNVIRLRDDAVPSKFVRVPLKVVNTSTHTDPHAVSDSSGIATCTVSCPGVWLCQDGRVSLTVFALGTSYQTCLLPPIFPLMFKDIFYFRKRFQETCALNNICCLLKDETIYCELVQWCRDCLTDECVVLAQYLGALNDVLFPPNMCSNDGVDLLMRRTKVFPGILSPKIEISTKVRIDEVWNQPCSASPSKAVKCQCSEKEKPNPRQKQVCHTPRYHRYKCSKPPSRGSLSRSKSRSEESCCSIPPQPKVSCACKPPSKPARSSFRRRPACSPTRTSPHSTQYCVYNVRTSSQPHSARTPPCSEYTDYDDDKRSLNDNHQSTHQKEVAQLQKVILESRYIDHGKLSSKSIEKPKKTYKAPAVPCVCEICKKYDELFHSNKNSMDYYKY